MIIEEGGVGPLLMLMKEGNIEGQNNAARAIGLLKVINSVVILITSASMLCEQGS
ncbi:armadillo repeat only protein [Trifolium pratense]|uniref:Armadillo repeat only protein n=1 Tax=Trifolium pratense TaxID=57577 RepID=A0A2K3K9R4_TRIPR|nr:armadillo repeat only protein [Trifolium pratense]